MFDEKLKRARQLIEKRDQIDEELRALFGDLPSPKRTRRRMEKDAVVGPEKESGAAASEVQR